MCYSQEGMKRRRAAAIAAGPNGSPNVVAMFVMIERRAPTEFGASRLVDIPHLSSTI